MITNDESQKISISTSIGLLGDAPNIHDLVVMSQKAGPSKFRYERDYNLQCDHCKIKGYAKENCYKLIGYRSRYPSSFNKKRRYVPKNGGSTYHNTYHVQNKTNYMPSGGFIGKYFIGNYHMTNINSIGTSQYGHNDQIVANVSGLSQNLNHRRN